VKLSKLTDVFHVRYGHKMNFNAMEPADDGVNFVSRSRANMGICGRVTPVAGVVPFPAGLITVTLGGTYLLSSFVQPGKFYTAQNIKVLQPKAEMSFEQKLAYCLFIERNRFRYSSHGREANRSLDDLLVPSPDALPPWVRTIEAASLVEEKHSTTQPPYPIHSWNTIALSKLFRVTNGVPTTGLRKASNRLDANYVPLVRPSRNSTPIPEANKFIRRVR